MLLTPKEWKEVLRSIQHHGKIIEAFADGQPVQILHDSGAAWSEPLTSANFSVEKKYRVQPQPAYTPLDADQLNELVGCTIVLKSMKPRGRLVVLSSGNDFVMIGSVGVVIKEHLLADYETMGGKPLGNLVS